MLQGAGGSGHEAPRFCACVGGFLPMPAKRERSLSPPSMYRNCAACQGMSSLLQDAHCYLSSELMAGETFPKSPPQTSYM